MFKSVDLFSKRYLQITLAFMLFVFVQNYFNFPHSIWIIIAGAMIYGGFHSGTVIKRSYLRLAGTIIGVAAVTLLWHILYLDYRLAIFFFVLIVGGCVFGLALPYDKFIVIVTLLSDILVELPNTADFNIQYYILDRLACTLIAFLMCVGIETLLFGRSSMMYLQYLDTLSKIKEMLQELYEMTQNNTLNTIQIIKKINTINTNLDQLSLIVADAKYVTDKGYRNFQLSEEDKQINIDSVAVFRKIISIYYVRKNDPYNIKLPILTQEVEAFLEQTH